jgi:hypothetical protein
MSLRGGVRCILYIVFSLSVRRFSVYLRPVYVLYMWPLAPDNISCIFLTVMTTTTYAPAADTSRPPEARSATSAKIR